MRFRASRPSVVDLYSAPELAVLAVLEAAIDVALIALIAAHPDDVDDDSVSPESRAAHALVEDARDVAAAVNRYRLALACARERERDDLLPF